jgi:alkanesulfonate monooxygenase SsuD/methylene tetrahydromethanopterin reductase-like flavin-dependent oxidoreductase (luciferase family)
VRIGVLILPEHRWPVAAEMWRRAEELGFDHAWTYDHIAWRTLRDEPWFAAVPTLTAAALATTTIRLGTLVASPNFRHPVPFARELITLDDMSNGRITVGLGAGGEGWDATILGQEAWSRRERLDRFVEFVDLLDELLREPATTRRGRFYSADDAPMHPGCVQRPRIPFAVAASGPGSMRIAARLAQTWVTNGDRLREPVLDGQAGVELVSGQMRRLDEICVEEGRDPGTLDRLVLTGARLDPGFDSPAAFAEAAAGYRDAGVTDLVVHWPRATEPYQGDPAILEHIALERFT